MGHVNSPTTIIELETWMKTNCFNFNSYAINGNNIDEGFGIENTAGLFVWYYTERGKKDAIKHFHTEQEIVRYAFEQIRADKWAKTHCIGFSANFHKIAELKNELRQMNIDFFGGQIPFYGVDSPVYRIYVLGCDILKTAHLKEIYMNEKPY
ncbi:hypothetical protein [Pedobacter ureilyticus]|uniref:Uncharacterized protein n=1 Tax=Pedobacter ureilyticus TaxID=1393051 RepID=A0ABW9JB42_9SPHI|nr:hypothetical protein [Pedobacter helvus]